MANGFGGADAGHGRSQGGTGAPATGVTFGSGGSLGTIVLVLAWVLAAVMAVCFVAAVVAFRYARRAPGSPGAPGQDAGSSPGIEAPPTQPRPAIEPERAPEEDVPARLDHEDPLVRVGAIASLKGRPDAEEFLVDALGDEYPLVRREAVRALGEIGSGRATHALIEVAGHDPSAEVREEAVAALGALLRERQSGPS